MSEVEKLRLALRECVYLMRASEAKREEAIRRFHDLANSGSDPALGEVEKLRLELQQEREARSEERTAATRSITRHRLESDDLYKRLQQHEREFGGHTAAISAAATDRSQELEECVAILRAALHLALDNWIDANADAARCGVDRGDDANEIVRLRGLAGNRVVGGAL